MVENSRAGIQEKEKDTQRAMTEEKETGKCKDPRKDLQERQYSTEIATDAGKRDTPKERVRKWEKDSREIATRVENKDTHGINVQNSHTGKEKEREE